MKQSRLQKGKKTGVWALRFKAIFCALVLGATLTVPVGAETAGEKYERLKAELAGIGEAIQEAEEDVQHAEQIMVQLQAEEDVLSEMISLNQQEIAETEMALDRKEAEVAQQRQVIYENDQLFQQRLVAIYQMNNSSVLSRALTVDSFSELLQVVDALQRISQNDTDLLTLLSEQRAILESEQAEIDAMLLNLTNTYTELENNAAVLAGNIVAQDAAITQAEAEAAAQEVAYEAKEDEVEAARIAYEAMLAATRSVGGSTSGDGSQYVGGVFMWPVPSSYRITCHFGAPDPNGNGHLGMDIGAASGAEILAAGNGVVVVSTSHSSYGNYVMIDHGDGVKTLYAHNSQNLVGVGTPVTTGQTIALIGSTGFSTGPHLHFEVHANGGRQNPLNYLQG